MPNKLWDSDLTNVCTVSVKNDPLCCSSTVVKKQLSKKFFGRGRFRLDIYKSFPLSSLLASPKKSGQECLGPRGVWPPKWRSSGALLQTTVWRERERMPCLSVRFFATNRGGDGKKPWQTPHTLLQDSSHFVLRNRLSPLKLHKVEKSTGSKDDGRETKKKTFFVGEKGEKGICNKRQRPPTLQGYKSVRRRPCCTLFPLLFRNTFSRSKRDFFLFLLPPPSKPPPQWGGAGESTGKKWKRKCTHILARFLSLKIGGR